MGESLRNYHEDFGQQDNGSELDALAIESLSRRPMEHGDDLGYSADGDQGVYDRHDDSGSDDGDEDFGPYDGYNDGDLESGSHHCDDERSFVDEKYMELYTIDLPPKILERYSFISELPHGVAVMGGVARSIAREVITGEREPIRDIDLVNIVDEDWHSSVDRETLDELSRKYMPDDYAFGHGIENDTVKHYFKSRDFTINQSLIMDGKLVISDLAYDDFQENIIRPTYFEHRYEDTEVSSRLFLKALMMRGVISQISDSIPLIEGMRRPSFIGAFDVALFLNKAMSRGARTAMIFTKDLVDWDVISTEYRDRPVALAKSLLDRVYSFEFRPSTDKRFADIEECNDMGAFFAPDIMLEYHASNPMIRQAIAEYEDSSNAIFDGNDERLSGHYTQAEYDWINSAGK